MTEKKWMEVSGMTPEELEEELWMCAREGNAEAVGSLSELIGEGIVAADGWALYDLECLRCLQGDADAMWRMYLSGRKVTNGFIEDYLARDAWVNRGSDWDVVSVRRVSDTSFEVIKERTDGSGKQALEEVHFYDDDPLALLEDSDREDAVGRLRCEAEKGSARAAYDLVRMDPDGSADLRDLAEADPRTAMGRVDEALRIVYGVQYDLLFPFDAAPEGLIGDMEELRHRRPEYGYLLAVWMYAGRILERDPAKALEYALEAAEDGYSEAADLVSVMTDSPLETDGIRDADMSPEKLEKFLRESSRHMSEYGIMCLRQRPYHAPGRMPLQDGQEWRLITNLTDSEYYGETDSASSNDSGGFEDGTLSIRPFDWGYDEDPERASRPNFLFKPSGFNMEWYKYPWRSPMMSENLSLGEIRRIWRLCIDHLLSGRTFPDGDTRSLLALEPARTPVPDRLAERTARVLETASAQDRKRVILSGDVGCSTYRPLKRPTVRDDRVAELTEEIRRRA